jgi:hypothetical protein
MQACPLAERRRRDAKASAEGAREVRRLAVAHEARDLSHADRRLLVEQRRRRRQPARAKVLLKGARVEALVCPLDLPRRCAEGAREQRERQATPVVPRDESARREV